MKAPSFGFRGRGLVWKRRDLAVAAQSSQRRCYAVAAADIGGGVVSIATIFSPLIALGGLVCFSQSISNLNCVSLGSQ